MSKTKYILNGQSLLDFVVEHTGEASNLYAVALANSITVYDSVPVGTGLLIPDELYVNNDVISFFQTSTSKPATFGAYNYSPDYIQTYLASIAGISVQPENYEGNSPIVKQGQSLFDFVIEYTGEASNAYAVALANNISVSTIVNVGQKLIIPDSITITTAVTNFFSNRISKPATLGTFTGSPDGEYNIDEYDNEEYYI